MLKSKATKSPIDDLQAGIILDIMVAENVMGWHHSDSPHSDWFDKHGLHHSVGSFRPSTRDEHALEALEKFTCATIFKLNDGWTCAINPWNGCSGKTFALAVSRAVVKESLIDHPPDPAYFKFGKED